MRSGRSARTARDDVSRHPRADVHAAADASGTGRPARRAARRTGARRCPSRRGRGSARRRLARAVPAAARADAFSEPLTPRELVDVQDPHRASSFAVDRFELVRHPRRREARPDVLGTVTPEPRAQLRVACQRREPPSQRSRCRRSARDTRSRRSSRPPPCRPRASRRRAAQRRGTRSRRPASPRSPMSSASRRTPRTRRMSSGSRRSGIDPAPRGRRERLDGRAVLTVADEHELRIDP